jgi:hypothetical protein
MAPLYRSVAPPFFDTCRSVADIDRVLSADPPNGLPARLLSIDGWNRSATALIAAKFAGNPGYPTLVDRYGTFLAGIANGYYLKHYEALRTILDERGQSGHAPRGGGLIAVDRPA